jgi:arginyl-tRNA synthetase
LRAPRALAVPDSVKFPLETLLAAAVRTLVGTLLPEMPEASLIVVERTRDSSHGDYASNVAMRLAKGGRRQPQEMARAIVDALPASPLVSKTEIAGSGFINFFLAPAALAREIRRIHELGDAFGRSTVGAERIVVDYDLPDITRGRRILIHRGGKPLEMTLDQLQSRIGIDAYRFFFLMRSAEQPLDFDLDVVAARTNENPLYCVQYVPARVASVMKEVKARSIAFDLAVGLDNLGLLQKEAEQALIIDLLRFPEEVGAAAANCAPHSIVYYLRDVANAFHTYYNAEKWIVEETDLRNARLALVLAAGQVIRNGLALLGVSAPESM